MGRSNGVGKRNSAYALTMSITLKPGTRLISAVCSTEMIVVKTPGGDVELTIGGVDALAAGTPRDDSASIVAGHDGGTSMGKRYIDIDATLELLCTKPGPGVPAVGGILLVIKGSAPLPSSD